MGSYHASEHVIIEGSGMITGGASQDLGGISIGSSGLIFIYDGSIGGNGASRVLYDKFGKVLGRALRILTECPCNAVHHSRFNNRYMNTKWFEFKSH